jgi:hypothetical protein
MLIPTKLKFKLPQTMTYPIGAEAISQEFTDVPQFEKLVIWFTTTNFAFASDFQEARRKNEPYKIFEVSMIHTDKHLSSPKQFIEEGFYEEHWEIRVYAVSRELKSVANRLLIEQGLPKAKIWLETPRTANWKTGRKYFQVLFHEKESLISIKQD